MNLLDQFRSVLTGVRDLAESGTFKDAVERDLAALENAAANGIDSVQRHIAGWFGAAYAIDPGTGAQPVTPGGGTAAPATGGSAATSEAPVPAAGTTALPTDDDGTGPLGTAPAATPGQDPLPGT